MELDRRHLYRPDHLGQLGDAQLVGVQPVPRKVQSTVSEPLRCTGRHALLMDLVAGDSGREAMQHARALPQRVDDPVADAEVVVDEVELGRPERREVHAVGIGDSHDALADGNLDCRLLGGCHHRTVPRQLGGVLPGESWARQLSWARTSRHRRMVTSICRWLRCATGVAVTSAAIPAGNVCWTPRRFRSISNSATSLWTATSSEWCGCRRAITACTPWTT